MYRKLMYLSQMKLAEKCGTAASYIGEIEIGRKFPSVDMVERIAKALDIEAYLLFKETKGTSSLNDEAKFLYENLSPKGQKALVDLMMHYARQGLLKALMPELVESEELVYPVIKENQIIVTENGGTEVKPVPEDPQS